MASILLLILKNISNKKFLKVKVFYKNTLRDKPTKSYFYKRRMVRKDEVNSIGNRD